MPSSLSGLSPSLLGVLRAVLLRLCVLCLFWGTFGSGIFSVCPFSSYHKDTHQIDPEPYFNPTSSSNSLFPNVVSHVLRSWGSGLPHREFERNIVQHTVQPITEPSYLLTSVNLISPLR